MRPENITPEQAGYQIRASRSKISRVEHGRVGFKVRDVEDLLSLYGVTDERERHRMLVLAQQANNQGWWAKYDDIMPDWFESYVGLEQATSLIRTYELQFVPGLFQTEDYARAVTVLGHRPPAERDRAPGWPAHAAPGPARHPGPAPHLGRHRRVGAAPPGGGRDVMRAQLRHLMEVADLPRVTLQVMPFSQGGHPAAGGSFTIMRFAEPDLPDIVYIEQLTGALYLDRRDEADNYMEVMNRLSAEAETPRTRPTCWPRSSRTCSAFSHMTVP